MLALNRRKLPRFRSSALVLVFSMLGSIGLQEQSHAQDLSPTTTVAQLQAGDILLVPLNCYVCNAIEKETGVPYSHSVVVANASKNLENIDVYEAWGTTRKAPLVEIIKRAEKRQHLFHMRPREFIQEAAPTAKSLAAIFKRQFANTVFDDEFLWDNVDERGIEKIYCAEFVVKFINYFLKDPQQPEPMSFGKLKDFWEKYYQQFNLEIPEGKSGASPALIFLSDRFVKIGTFIPETTETLELP
ncbi:MAG: hypothetical protein RI932_4 [Pseudomonadota bacterium]|jgi:hypothetical protein